MINLGVDFQTLDARMKMHGMRARKRQITSCEFDQPANSHQNQNLVREVIYYLWRASIILVSELNSCTTYDTSKISSFPCFVTSWGYPNSGAIPDDVHVQWRQDISIRPAASSEGSDETRKTERCYNKAGTPAMEKGEVRSIHLWNLSITLHFVIFFNILTTTNCLSWMFRLCPELKKSESGLRAFSR